MRGVTPQLLYGLDAAPMGLVDASTGDPMAGVDNSDGSMDHGWAAYFTLYSAESTLKSDGTQKINLNGNDLQQLYSDLQNALDENSAMFIVLYRTGGKKRPTCKRPAHHRRRRELRRKHGQCLKTAKRQRPINERVGSDPAPPRPIRRRPGRGHKARGQRRARLL